MRLSKKRTCNGCKALRCIKDGGCELGFTQSIDYREDLKSHYFPVEECYKPKNNSDFVRAFMLRKPEVQLIQ